MQYDKLRYFKASAQIENFTQAARELGVSQAYLSRAIKALESDLGTPLFVRRGRRVQLNEAGRMILQATESVERILSNARQEISNVSLSDKQSIRLVARSPLGNFPAVLKGFHDAHPTISVSVVTPGNDKIGVSYDLEYFASHEECRDDNVRKLCTDDYVLLVSNRSRLAKRRSISVQDVKEAYFVTSPLDTQMSQAQAQIFEQAGFEPKIRCYSSSYWALLNLVEQNIGVCIGCNRSWLTKMNLKVKAIPFSDVGVARSLYVRWPQDAYLTDAAIALIQYLEDLFDAGADASVGAGVADASVVPLPVGQGGEPCGL